MNKIAVFVLGPDRPGIISTVSRKLFEHGCNLEDVSQTILQNEFIGIFITSMPDAENADALLASLQSAVSPMGLLVHLTAMQTSSSSEQNAAEPFIITTVGPDRPGLVAGITEVLARHGVNITNLKAVSRGLGKQQHYIMIYEVDVPHASSSQLRTDLHDRARDLGLDINLQHREIFQQIHRV